MISILVIRLILCSYQEYERRCPPNSSGSLPHSLQPLFLPGQSWTSPGAFGTRRRPSPPDRKRCAAAECRQSPCHCLPWIPRPPPHRRSRPTGWLVQVGRRDGAFRTHVPSSSWHNHSCSGQHCRGQSWLRRRPQSSWGLDTTSWLCYRGKRKSMHEGRERKTQFSLIKRNDDDDDDYGESYTSRFTVPSHLGLFTSMKSSGVRFSNIPSFSTW